MTASESSRHPRACRRDAARLAFTAKNKTNRLTVLPTKNSIRVTESRLPHASEGSLDMPAPLRTLQFALGLLASLFLMVSAFAAEAGPRVALVVGMAKYQNIPSLGNTAKDATAIADKLKALGFEVDLSIDQPLVQLVDTINAFSFKAETADIAMVYYAGHGVELNGENFLIPIDIKITKPEQIASQAITLKMLLKSVENARKLRVVILDSCRNN
eukprot:gene8521-11554_t